MKNSNIYKEVLLDIANKLNYCHDASNNPYAIINNRAVPVESNNFMDYLIRMFYEQKKNVPSKETLQSVIGYCKGRARYDSPMRELFNKIGYFEKAIYYDLNDTQFVKITPQGWEIILESPILFMKYPHQLNQVEPIPSDYHIQNLLEFTNIKGAENQLLFLVYLTSCFIPHITHPILHVHGAQGSGKSTLLKICKSIIEPSISDVFMIGKNEESLMLTMRENYFSCFDNLSGLSWDQSDILACSCTGASFPKRMLFTTDHIKYYSIKSCIAINGINIVAIKPDLLDRTLLIELERLNPNQRKGDKDLYTRLKNEMPKILGCIFTIVSQVLAIQPAKLEQTQRLVDFTQWGYTIAEVIGYGGEAFLNTYQKAVKSQTEEVISSSTLAQAVISFMEGKPMEVLMVKDLFENLSRIAGGERLHIKHDKSFPTHPNKLIKALNRIKSNLADCGIEYEIWKRTSQGVLISLLNTALPLNFNASTNDGVPAKDNENPKPVSADSKRVKEIVDNLTDEEKVEFEERAGIMEYDAGLTKEEAEKSALNLW